MYLRNKGRLTLSSFTVEHLPGIQGRHWPRARLAVAGLPQNSTNPFTVLTICNLPINTVSFYNELPKYIRKVHCKSNTLNNAFFIDFPELSYSTIPEFRQEAITPKMCSTLIHSMGIGNATYCRQCNQKRLKSLILISIPKVLLISASCITTCTSNV